MRSAKFSIVCHKIEKCNYFCHFLTRAVIYILFKISSFEVLGCVKEYNYESLDVTVDAFRSIRILTTVFRSIRLSNVWGLGVLH